MGSHKTRRMFLATMVVAGSLSFGLSTSAQTIYKCQLPNGQIEYTDMHCAGADSKVVHIRGDSKPLSNMTLVDLRSYLKTLIDRLRLSNSNMYQELRQGWAHLGPHPTNAALTAVSKDVRNKWDPEMQAEKSEILRVQGEIDRQCASGATVHDPTHICR